MFVANFLLLVNILLALITGIHCAQIFLDLIFVVEYYPQKLNRLEKFGMYGIQLIPVYCTHNFSVSPRVESL